MALSAIVGLLVAAPSWACWDEAAARYGLSSHLLYAIARTESGLNPAAVGRNRDGSPLRLPKPVGVSIVFLTPTQTPTVSAIPRKDCVWPREGRLVLPRLPTL